MAKKIVMSEGHYAQLMENNKTPLYEDYDVKVYNVTSEIWNKFLNKNHLQYEIVILKNNEKFFIDIDEKLILDESGMDIKVISFLTKYPQLTDFLSDKADVLIRTKFNEVGENKKRQEMGWPTLIDFYTLNKEDFHKYRLYGKS